MEQGESWASAIWTPEVRIANPPPALLAKYTEKEKAFFYDYANFVLGIIGHHLVNDRLRQIIAIEGLRLVESVDVRVMVFPARPLRGRNDRMLHGSYSHSASQISLYPLKLPRACIRGEGIGLFKTPFESLSERKKRLLHEISDNAIATLVHEVLHVKFEHRDMARYVEESIVRKLERQYMQGWKDIILAAVLEILSQRFVSSGDNQPPP